MSPIIGNLIVIAILAVIVFFSLRTCIRMMRDSLTGKGCSGCGSAGQCSCGCASCGQKKKTAK